MMGGSLFAQIEAASEQRAREWGRYLADT